MNKFSTISSFLYQKLLIYTFEGEREPRRGRSTEKEGTEKDTTERDEEEEKTSGMDSVTIRHLHVLLLVSRAAVQIVVVVVLTNSRDKLQSWSHLSLCLTTWCIVRSNLYLKPLSCVCLGGKVRHKESAPSTSTPSGWTLKP